jgi:hypothetical protein
MKSELYLKLLDIFESTTESNIDEGLKLNNIAIIDLSIPQEEIEVPILVGHLNRNMGYNGYHLNLPGTPVYEFGGKYYFESFPENEQLPIRKVTFTKDRGFEKDIKFLNN